MNCDYGNVEKVLNDEFKVHHLFRDTRGDSGDDGGYIVAISEKSEKFYLHIIPICQFCEIEFLNIDETWSADNTGFPDFIECNSIKDAQQKLNGIIKNLDHYLTENNDYSRDADEIYDFFEGNISKTEAEYLATIMFPYSEYEQDKETLLNLSKTSYVPNFEN